MLQPFTTEQVGTIVGFANVPPGRTFTDTFEVAAWWVEHAFVPSGPHPVRLRANRYGTAPVHGFSLVIDHAPTEVVGANLTSLSGGVPVGANRAGEDQIGRPAQRPFLLASTRRLCDLHAVDLSDFAFTKTQKGYEVYGRYAENNQFLHARCDTLRQALQCVHSNPSDHLTIIKVLEDGTRTTEY